MTLSGQEGEKEVENGETWSEKSAQLGGRSGVSGLANNLANQTQLSDDDIGKATHSKSSVRSCQTKHTIVQKHRNQTEAGGKAIRKGRGRPFIWRQARSDVCITQSGPIQLPTSPENEPTPVNSGAGVPNEGRGQCVQSSTRMYPQVLSNHLRREPSRCREGGTPKQAKERLLSRPSLLVDRMHQHPACAWRTTD